MNKRGKNNFLGIFLALLFLIAIFHSFSHFTFFGTGIKGFYKTGISGFSVGKINLGEEIKTKYSAYSPISKIALILEWGLVIMLIVMSMIRSRINFKKETFIIKKTQVRDKSKIKTDIDVLYSVLKEKKQMRMSTISKTFDVDKETVMDWCKILESGNLATIQYPKFGEPRITLEEAENNE